MNDYYNILGIERSASEDQIKTAYRKLASKYHPDRGGDTKKFQEIQEAYDTLKDPEKKQAYDNIGHMPNSNPFEEIFKNFNIFTDFPDAINFFKHQSKNKNINLSVTITLEDAFNGRGALYNVKFPSGREQIIEVKIPKGIPDNSTLRIYGIGDDSIPNIPRGDIFFTVNILPHEKFKRLNDDLEMIIKINCFEAILGKQVEIETIEKKSLIVNIPPGAQHNQTFSISDHGMFNTNSSRGRLLLKLNITIPTNLTEDQKNTIKKLI
jgi:curved DNA-binding protein